MSCLVLEYRSEYYDTVACEVEFVEHDVASDVHRILESGSVEVLYVDLA